MNLTKPQKLIYDMEKFAGGAIAVICGSMLIHGKQDLSELKRAVNEIYRLNDALRIHISETDGDASQSVAEYVERNIEVLYFDDKAELDRYAENYAKTPIDFHGDLCDIAIVILPEQHGLLVKLHHIIGDAWTLSLIGNQFNTLLNGDVPEAYSYTDYIESENSYFNSKRYAKDKDFFLEQFKKCDEVTYLSEKQNDTLHSCRKTFVIDSKKAKQITDYVQKNGTSAFTLFTAALSAYINRTKMNAEKFHIGTAVLNRDGAKEKNTMGMFVNTVPMLIELDNTISFADNLESVQKTAFSILRHQKYNYGDVLSTVRKEYGFTEKLYDVMISYQNATIAGADIETTWYHCGMQNESMQIHIDDRDNEGIFRIHYDYQTEKFTEYEIEMLHQHTCKLLFDAMANDNKKLYELELLTAAEKQRLLYDFNDTAADYPRDKCVHQLFEEQAEKSPDKSAVVASDKTLTYAELNEQANKIAHSLIEKGVRQGDIVAFMLPRRSYLIATMLGILKSGAAYLPIDPDYPQDRIVFMLEDSKAKFCVTEENIYDLLGNPCTDNPAIAIGSESLCYCIYTSGSTGKPKGTLLTHGNVSNFVNNNNNNVAHSVIKDSYKNILSLATVGFDMFTTESLLPVANGMEILLANEEQAKMQSKLNDFIKLNPADVMETTPTKMKALIADKTRLDYLKTVKVFILGGEALDNSLLEELRQITDAKIFNLYGPTEATVWATYAEIKGEDITIGKTMANAQIYIVDQYMQPTPIGVTGELCIAGDGVGAGYLNRPELTAEKFIDNPFGEGKLYKTGDLAYYREDGNIVYVGRNDFQVKIRGLRIELEEIENAVCGVDGILQAVVVVRKNNEGRELICAFYTGAEIDAKDIRSHIGAKLPKYMLPHIITHLDDLPLTSSGKINRKTLPEVDLYAIDTTVEYVAPQTEQEKLLVSAVESVLKIEKVGVADNFIELGGDSLSALGLISALEPKGYTVPVWETLSGKTLKELANSVSRLKEDHSFVFSRKFEASLSQKRVYYADMLSDTEMLYHVPFVCMYPDLDKDRLENALLNVIRNNSALMSTFSLENGVLYQTVREDLEVKIERWNGSYDEFIRPFDLEKGPLFRVGMCADAVLFDFHHIVFDGRSVYILLNQIKKAYEGENICEKNVVYDDIYDVCDDFPERPERELPEPITLAPAREMQSNAGTFEYFTIKKGLYEKILDICVKEELTPFCFYLTGFYLLLKGYTGKDDLSLGITHDKRDASNADRIGMFAEVLSLRCDFSYGDTVCEMIQHVREAALCAIRYADRDNEIKNISNESASVSMLFNYYKTYEQSAETRRRNFRQIDTNSSKYELTFHILAHDNDAELCMEYSSELFSANRIALLWQSYIEILEQMLDVAKPLEEISCIGRAERAVLDAVNLTKADFPSGESIYSLFEKQASKRLDDICMCYGKTSYTYNEFLHSVELLAHEIQEKTKGQKEVVAVIADRSPEMYISIYAIIRGGNAYLPIIPSLPQERIDYMLDDCGVGLVLCQDRYISLAHDKGINVTDFLKSDNGSVMAERSEASPDDIAYVIYTSGSSGKPKGVRVSNRSVVNRISWMERKYPLGKDGTILQKTPYSFDVSVWELFWWGMYGGKMAFCAPNEHFIPKKIVENVNSFRVTHLHFVPSVFDVFIEYLSHFPAEIGKLGSLKHIFLSGEKLHAVSVKRFHDLAPSIQLHNLYGPTECTVDATYYDCIGDEGDIPIGRPIDNTQIYIISDKGKRLPLYAIGELCIAGEGVACGYQSLLELTEEKFTSDPFGTGRMYHTGDLAYIDENGYIMFCGRMDDQIKINGQRVEPGEIEKVFGDNGAVSAYAGLYERDGVERLVVFYTGDVSERRLINECRLKLPSYMVPAAAMRVKELPLGNNGKVKKDLLPYHMIEFSDGADIISEPINDIERSICELYQDILRVDHVGRDSDFIALGGTSLQIIRLLSDLPVSSSVTVADLMSDPTPAGIAARLMGASAVPQRIKKLYTVPGVKKALIMIPYAGGDAASLSQILKTVKERALPINLYTLDFIHDDAEYPEVAHELSSGFVGYDISFYAHCAGNAVAMKLIGILEREYGLAVSDLFSTGFIPIKQNRNLWRMVPDGILTGVLSRAGSGIDRLAPEIKREFLRSFREDAECAFKIMKDEHISINAPVHSLISKSDMFTKEYRKSQKYWSAFSSSVDIEYIDSKSHYFIADKADDVVDWINKKSNGGFYEA